MRNALVTAVLAIALLLAPIAVMAADGSVSVQIYNLHATLRYAVYSSDVSIAANSTFDIPVNVPDWLSGHVDAIRVYIINASGSASLTALDANNTKLVTADVIPLSSAYELTLPANTAKISLGVTSPWNGTVTIIVESGIDFDVNIPSPITIHNGSAEVTAHVTQKSGPAGKIALGDDNPYIDIKFRDPQPEYSGDDWVETSGAGWEADIPVVITAGGVKPGTYVVTVTMYFSAQDVGTLEVKKMSFTFDLSGDSTGSGSTTTTSTTSESIIDQIKADPTKAALIGVGILVFFALIIMAFSGGKSKRGMAKLTGEVFIVLMMMLVAAIGVAITMVSKEYAMAMGVGVAAFLILLLFMSAGKIKVASGGG